MQSPCMTLMLVSTCSYMCNTTVASFTGQTLFLFLIFFASLESMDELSLKAGDLIMLKTRVGSDWLRGRTINGKEGIFPKSYVEVVVSQQYNVSESTLCCLHTVI